MTGKISVVIPAFNEAATIAVCIAETREYFSTRGIPFEIIVVAEGSDGTGRIAREAAALDDRVRVIAGDRRRGKGAAVREGVLAATGDVIGFMDADRKTAVAELDKILPRLGDVPVVIGSRSAEGARIGRRQNLVRRAGSRFFSVYLHVVLGLREIPDTQCGLKFFRADIARELFSGLMVGGYVFDVELLYICLRRGIAIEEVGVQWSDDGDSRLNVLAGNVRNFFDVFRIALRYRIGSPPLRDSIWPKRPPQLSAAQLTAREQFVREWLELLPARYSVIERFNHSVAKLPHKDGAKTLEIGAGLGEHLRYERTDQDYHCLEYREEFCRTLSDRVGASHVHHGDIQQRQSQWPDKTFDRIIAIHVLEHLPSLPDAIREISRLLKDDGVFDVVLPCEGGPAYWLARKISAERLFRRRFKMDYGPIIRSEHVNTHGEVIGLLRRFFHVERVRFFPTFIPIATINLVAAYRLTRPRGLGGARTPDSAPHWSDELTEFHENHAGGDHFIDVASRRHAAEMLAAHGPKTGTILDAGCSSGFLIRELRARFPSLVVMGSDVVEAPLERLRAALPDVTLLMFDLVRCPLPSDSLDAVILLNVLEHIEDDGAALGQVHRILKPGGLAIIEVPAGPGLFDVYDELLMHYRRYRRSDLTWLVSNAGFEIVDKSHLGFFLFPPFFVSKKLSRFMSRVRKTEPRQAVSRKIQSTRRNVVARGLMNFELALGRRVSFPFGIRCLVTARKK